MAVAAKQNKSDRMVKYNPFTLRKNYTNGDVNDYGLLTWAIRAGYPRITVWTSNALDVQNVNNKDIYGKMITAPFDIITFNTFISLFIEILKGDKNEYRKIECHNIKFTDGVKTNETYLQASVIFGKNKDGIPVLSVVSDNKVKLVFDISPQFKWHKYYDANNNIIEDKAKIASTFALRYLETLREFVNFDCRTDISEVIPLDSKPGAMKPKVEVKEEPKDEISTHTISASIDADKIDDMEDLFK